MSPRRINPDRKISTRRGGDGQTEFLFEEFDEAGKIKVEVSDKYDRAAERASRSRSIFAQHAIQAQEIEQDLWENDEAIGSPAAVMAFVLEGLRSLFGVQINGEGEGYRLYIANLPPSALAHLPKGASVLVSFESPTPENHLYLGRNHPFIEQICQIVLAHTIGRQRHPAARASVMRTAAVTKPTTLLLFRCRNVIEEKKGTGRQLVAEEMLLWGYRGSPDDQDFLTVEEAHS
ncbi:MAG: hypothetical protein WCK77_12030 [Verrucomicrobiota bacterium]